jgi:eukaryotic-like serine/threonine-protein kinase
MARGRPAYRRIAAWVRDLASGLAYANGEGVVHRDIKPANIMLGPGETPMLIDFGLATRLDRDDQTTDGVILGTPAYMAPEQAQGDHDQVGPKSDQYSLGVVLFELLTGQRPFRGSTKEVLAQILHQEPVPPSRIVKDVPRDLEVICLKAMEKDPARRYPDAGELAIDLNRWLLDEPIHARPIGRLHRTYRQLRRQPILLGAFAFAAVALVVAIGLWRYSVSSRNDSDLKIAKATEDRKAAEGEANKKAKIATSAQRRRDFEELLATWHRGRRDCEARQIGPGLIHLSRALLSADRLGATDLEQGLRADIAVWRNALIPLRLCVRHQQALGPYFFPAAIAYDPSGRRLLIRTRLYQGSGLRLFDLETGLQVGEDIGGSLDYEAVAFRPDGKAFVAFGPSDAGIRLYDSATLKPIGPKFRNRWSAQFVTFTPDGSRVMTYGNGMAELWDPQTGKRLGSEFPLLGPPDQIFSPKGGRYLVTSHSDVTPTRREVYQIRDTTTGATVVERAFKSFPFPKTVAAFDPAGRELVVGSAKSLEVLDASSWERIRELKLPRENETGLTIRYSPDGEALLVHPQVVGVNGWIAVVKSASGNVLLFRDNVAVNAPSFSADGQLLMTCENDRVRFWELTTGKELVRKALEHPGKVLCATFSPDGKRILTGCDDKFVRVWDAETNKVLGDSLVHEGPITNVAFGPDGRSILAYGESYGSARIHVWDSPREDRLPRAPQLRSAVEYVKPFEAPRSQSEPEDSRRLDIAAWLKGQPKPVPVEHVAFRDTRPRSEMVYANSSIRFSVDGRRVLVGLNGNKVGTWDLESSKLVGEILEHPAGTVLASSSNLKQILIGLRQNGNSEHRKALRKTTILWDLDAKGSGTLLDVEGELTAAVFGADDRTVAVAALGKAQTFDTSTGQAIGPGFAPGYQITALAIRPDGKTILTGGDGPSVARRTYTYEKKKGKEVIKVTAPTDFVVTGRAHLSSVERGGFVGSTIEVSRPVFGAMFSPDGRTACLDLIEGTIVFVDDDSGKVLRSAKRPWSELSSVVHRAITFSPDGSRLIVGREDHIAWIIDVPTARFLWPPLVLEDGIRCVAFAPDAKSFLTGQVYSASRWPVPPACVEDAKTVALRCEVETGLEIDPLPDKNRRDPAPEPGRLLDPKSWLEKRIKLGDATARETVSVDGSDSRSNSGQ